MPEILKTNGQTDWSKIFMAFAAALVLILQQWQTYKIAELKAEAEVNKVNFLEKDKVYQIANSLQKRMDAMEDGFISKGELLQRFSAIDDRLDALESSRSQNKPF